MELKLTIRRYGNGIHNQDVDWRCGQTDKGNTNNRHRLYSKHGLDTSHGWIGNSKNKYPHRSTHSSSSKHQWRPLLVIAENRASNLGVPTPVTGSHPLAAYQPTSLSTEHPSLYPLVTSLKYSLSLWLSYSEYNVGFRNPNELPPLAALPTSLSTEHPSLY